LQLDTTALGSLLVYHAVSCLLPPFAACHPGQLAFTVLPALIVLAPLLLGVLRPCQRWYRCHRDWVLILTYLALASHHALDLSAQLQGAGEGMRRVVLVRVELAWSLVLGVLLQVGAARCAGEGARAGRAPARLPQRRHLDWAGTCTCCMKSAASPNQRDAAQVLQVQFVGQCATVAAGLLLKALFLPRCLKPPPPTATLTCTSQPPGGSPWLLPARGMLLKLLAPCAVAYCMELSARRAFCRTVALDR
jgi:hypothetical protein